MIKHFALLVIFFVPLFAQETKVSRELRKTISTQGLSHKVLSGLLYRRVQEKTSALPGYGRIAMKPKITTILYFASYPTAKQFAELEVQGVSLFKDTWTPPLERHPFGFFIAEVPIASIPAVLRLNYLEKMDEAESLSFPLNNQAAKTIKADSIWNRGWTGSGVKVAILDSGLDTSKADTDIPVSYEKRDYSNYPTSIDSFVANTVTGHGTHVTGSVLGRGTLSATNTANGGGAYRGMAYNADLVFLKIGSDANASASDAVEIAAMHAAVDTFHANIVSMSYGEMLCLKNRKGILSAK